MAPYIGPATCDCPPVRLPSHTMVLLDTGKLFHNIYIFTWDAYLTLVNLITPNLKPGNVIPHGSLGAGGIWPEYVPPKEGDSRCACPMLNTLANHGILPHDGRNIKFVDLARTVRATFNFAPTFPLFASRYAANMLHKNYERDVCNLAEISLHNGIEHDGSLTRQDVRYDPDQGRPYLPFIEELLACATGKDQAGNAMFTAADLSRYSSIRRAESRATNPEFTLAKVHKLFGSSNTAGLLAIFGGWVADLEVVLKEERIPVGWEPRAMSRKGLTIIAFQRTVLQVENGIKEEAVRRSM
ncbi:Chloroperoxidase [Mycena belliarum]|uniref:Chloroperoxidase n=1 Tax=Mycena belliarum TaxID=1033014 RepID=A0AAD6XWA2_9AGAR|nr:Chloroperoxidase [Mycena belliae]